MDTGSGGITVNDIWNQPVLSNITPGTFGEAVRLMRQMLLGTLNINSATLRLQLFAEDGVTVLGQWYLEDQNSNPSLYNIQQRVPVTPVV